MMMVNAQFTIDVRPEMEIEVRDIADDSYRGRYGCMPLIRVDGASVYLAGVSLAQLDTLIAGLEAVRTRLAGTEVSVQDESIADALPVE